VDRITRKLCSAHSLAVRHSSLFTRRALDNAFPSQTRAATSAHSPTSIP